MPAAENSMVGTCPPEAENFWKKWGQHLTTTLCYGIAAGLFLEPSEEIQRGTLSKTVGGSSWWWPSLTERDSVIFGEGEHMENRPSKVWCCIVGNTQIIC